MAPSALLKSSHPRCTRFDVEKRRGSALVHCAPPHVCGVPLPHLANNQNLGTSTAAERWSCAATQRVHRGAHCHMTQHLGHPGTGQVTDTLGNTNLQPLDAGVGHLAAKTGLTHLAESKGRRSKGCPHDSGKVPLPLPRPAACSSTLCAGEVNDAGQQVPGSHEGRRGVCCLGFCLGTHRLHRLLPPAALLTGSSCLVPQLLSPTPSTARTSCTHKDSCWAA